MILLLQALGQYPNIGGYTLFKYATYDYVTSKCTSVNYATFKLRSLIVLFSSLSLIVFSTLSFSMTVSVGLHDGKPFGWYDANEGYQGITLDNLREIVSKVYPDAELDIHLANPERIIYSVLREEIDLYIGVADPRLEGRAVNLGRLAEMNVELWRLSRDDEEDFDPFSGLLSVHKFYEGFPQLEGRRVREHLDHKYVMQQLKGGRIDGALGTATELCYTAKEFDYPITDFYRLSVAPLNVYLWGRKVDFIQSRKGAWEAAVKALSEQLKDNLKDRYCQ